MNTTTVYVGVTCPMCSGSGLRPSCVCPDCYAVSPCSFCQGTGVVVQYRLPSHPYPTNPPVLPWLPIPGPFYPGDGLINNTWIITTDRTNPVST